MLLRRQVSALRLRIRHEAALEERQRIAREFHDTLEQELAGLSLRMDAAVTRPMEDKARVLLETSRSLVSRIQAEARNLVADLRDDPVTQVDLASALRDLAERQPPNAPVIRLEVDSAMPVLSSPVVHHLRMIAQEAVTNALKHAQASSIVLRLRRDEGGLELSVIDDGAGFDPDGNTSGKPGHFGCMGIRERCRKIGAQVDWRSSPGQGTTLVVKLDQVG
jgi:signal transduction histidine kinase